MQRHLRRRLDEIITSQTFCALTIASDDGNPTVPARMLADGFDVECIIPRWSDPAFLVGAHRCVSLLIAGSRPEEWVQYQGTAEPITHPAWARYGFDPRGDAAHRYVAIRVAPRRIDLIDDDIGYGVIDTLELA